MPVRRSEAVWRGTLKEGNGIMRLASGLYEGPYTYSSRFEEAAGTNPEELVGAAHAGCFSMFLAALADRQGIRAGAHLHHGRGASGRGASHQEDRARVRGGGSWGGGCRVPGVGGCGESWLPGVQGAGRRARDRAERQAGGIASACAATTVDSAPARSCRTTRCE